MPSTYRDPATFFGTGPGARSTRGREEGRGEEEEAIIYLMVPGDDVFHLVLVSRILILTPLGHRSLEYGVHDRITILTDQRWHPHHRNEDTVQSLDPSRKDHSRSSQAGSLPHRPSTPNFLF